MIAEPPPVIALTFHVSIKGAILCGERHPDYIITREWVERIHRDSLCPACAEKLRQAQ